MPVAMEENTEHSGHNSGTPVTIWQATSEQSLPAHEAGTIIRIPTAGCWRVTVQGKGPVGTVTGNVTSVVVGDFLRPGS